ncbi:flagellin lysine-N-methylase [Parendozoicomonas haliclonae]|uniref:Flagellar biosynthetic protein FliU n=1 Tax=Parendozoicomonas haliclonae TaxID=1960125 RepID=A0A1X7ANF8_9GAMM|nr:flagellin lysine-N-methylase [Parendozoicomonas haliclonae]SMA49662.1 Flagellar biosynthetic protein FliU [Parendozoicomonas haliclonae]
MTATPNNILYPRFYQEFSCIGPDCEHDCCQNWRITIDRKTYKAYSKTTDPRLREVTDKMTRPRQQNDLDYRRIPLTEEGRCPLQNTDGTCHVHGEHGEQLLSITCKTYPRKIRKIANTVEASLTLSCPEAARKALLDPSAMMFEHGPNLPAGLAQSIIAKEPSGFTLFRQTAFQAVLGEKEMPDERLFRLGILFSLVARQQKDQRDITVACEEYLRMQSSGELSALYLNLSDGKRGLAIVLKELLTGTNFFRANKVLASYHQQMVKALQDNFTDGEVNLEKLLKARQPNLEQCINECGHGLVNMMLHWIYSSEICLKQGDDLLTSYAAFVLKYIIIRFYLLTLAEEGKNAELLIGVVHSLSRSADHNDTFLKNLYQLLADKGWGSHAQFLSLLK